MSLSKQLESFTYMMKNCYEKKELFSVFNSHVIKIRIVTIQWKNSRICDMIDDYNINNLANNQVSAVFHSRASRRSVSPKIYRALYGDAIFVSFRGTQTWRPWRNKNICRWVLLLKWKCFLKSSDTLKYMLLLVQGPFSYQNLKR